MFLKLMPSIIYIFFTNLNIIFTAKSDIFLIVIQLRKLGKMRMHGKNITELPLITFPLIHFFDLFSSVLINPIFQFHKKGGLI
jgi:hypothetical protein